MGRLIHREIRRWHGMDVTIEPRFSRRPYKATKPGDRLLKKLFRRFQSSS